MIDTLPPQTPEEIAIRRTRHDEATAARWPIVFGLVGTILFHLLAYFVADKQLLGLGSSYDISIPDDVATMREKYEQQSLRSCSPTTNRRRRYRANSSRSTPRRRRTTPARPTTSARATSRPRSPFPATTTATARRPAASWRNRRQS
jgi:hypothetical protein